MSLPAPTSLNLTQSGPTVALSWAAVTGADYYVIYRYCSTTSGTAAKIAEETTTAWTDYAVPIVVESGGSYVAATWRYKVAAVDGTGEGAFIDNPITMAQTSVANVDSFGLLKPKLQSGTNYDYDQISFGSTDSETQAERDSVFIAYLKTIET